MIVVKKRGEDERYKCDFCGKEEYIETVKKLSVGWQAAVKGYVMPLGGQYCSLMPETKHACGLSECVEKMREWIRCQ